MYTRAWCVYMLVCEGIYVSVRGVWLFLWAHLWVLQGLSQLRVHSSHLMVVDNKEGGLEGVLEGVLYVPAEGS